MRGRVLLLLLAATALSAMPALSAAADPTGPWHVSGATYYGPGLYGHRTACGGVIEPNTEGVAHPTLPCGMRIYLTVRGRHVLTEVIDHGPIPQGREFDLTDALAQVLGLSGVEQIRWSYASSG